MNDLQFIRNVSIFESYDIALEALSYLDHKVGQPAIAVYHEEDGSTINGILAIGVQNGSGNEAFAILASGRRMDDLVADFNKLLSNFNAHIVLPGDSELGHIKSGGDLQITNGIGTVVSNAITLAKMAKMISAGFIGTLTPGANPKILNQTEALQFLGNPEPNQFAFSNIKVGENIIRANQKTDTFEIVGDAFIRFIGDTKLKKITVSHTTGNGYEHIPSNGRAEQYLKWVSAGKAVWADLPPFPVHYTLKSVIDSDVILSGYTDEALAKIKESVFLPGNPTTTTQAEDNNTNIIATTAFVQSAINRRLKQANAMTYKGVIDASQVQTLPSGDAGDFYKFSVAGTISGLIVHANDTIVCREDDTLADQPTKWDLICVNDGAVMGPETAVEDNLAVFGPSGAIIKDSGIAKSTLVLNTRKIIAGDGIIGGGSLLKDITLDHQKAPTSKVIDAQIDGKDGAYITSVQLDKFGHVYKVTKGTPIPNSGSVGGTGYIVTKVEIVGNRLTGIAKEESKLNVDSAKRIATPIELKFSGMIETGVTTDFSSNVNIDISYIDDGEF